jgi:hypothetical protein
MTEQKVSYVLGHKKNDDKAMIVWPGQATMGFWN